MPGLPKCGLPVIDAANRQNNSRLEHETAGQRRSAMIPETPHMRRTAKYILSILSLVTAIGLCLKGTVIHVPTGTWAPSGSLTEPRTGAAGVLLEDGRILVTGGEGATGPVASAEFFSSGSFAFAPPMNVARSGHTAVVLQGGRVLVAGGKTSGGGITNAAEIYSPALNSWLVVDAMADARSGHTATLLEDGRVLLAGGEGPAGAVSTLEVFDPATEAFAFAGTMSSARKDHAAALLADGRVFLAGGSDGATALASSEIFNPRTDTLAAGPALSGPRAGLSATTLLDGKVLLAGGNNGSVDLASAELYSPATGTVSALASWLAAARRNHLAFLLPNNNHVLIVGGTSEGNALSTAELFRPWDGRFYPTGSMSVARAGAMGSPLGLDGLFLVAGGDASASSELYGFATVKTDKDDYAPGEAVTITGDGWQPGETVTLVLHEVDNPEPHDDLTLNAVANSAGKIFNNQFAPEEHDIGVRFYLTASGVQSQAMTTFTDNVPRVTQVSTDIFSPNQASSSGVLDSVDITARNVNNGDLTGFEIRIRPGTSLAGTLVRTFVIGNLAGNTDVIRNWDGKNNGTVFVADGLYTARAFANEAGENDANNAKETIIVDNTNPTVSLLSPANGATVTGNFDLEASPVDTNLDFVEFYVDSALVGTDNNSGGGWKSTLNTSDFTGGSHTWFAKAFDKAGNNASSSSRTFNITAANTAPTVVANNDTFLEGTAKTYTATWSDPNGGQSHTCTIDFGDGTGPQPANIAPAQPSTSGTCSATHTYADGLNAYTITVSVHDGTTNGTDTATATVNNVAPTIALAGANNVNEGSSYTLTLGTVVDPGPDTVASFKVNWGDGSNENFNGSPNGQVKTHTYTDGPNTYTITVDLVDEDGTHAAASKAITVNNVAPTITLTGANNVDEGSLYSLTLGSAVDPGADTIASYTIKWGDGTNESFSGSPNAQVKTHTYADGPNNYTITVDLVDEDGPYATAGSKAITVVNVAPTIALTGAVSVDEGSLYTLTLGTVVDPGPDAVTSYTVKWGDGTNESFGGSPNAQVKTHTYADGLNEYTITVDLMDEDGTHGAAGSKTITVNNVAPTVTSNDLNLSATSINENDSVTLSGSFIDPGTQDSHTVTIEWGDGSANTTLNLGAGVLNFSAQSHQYRDDNPSGTPSDNSTIKVTVKDKDNDSDDASKSITVHNVAPTLSNVGVTSPINENGAATLTGNITDPGTLDTFTLVINWGDGSVPETHNLAAGTSLIFSEPYLSR